MPLPLPHVLVRRALEDLAALGDAARALPRLLDRVDAIGRRVDRIDERVAGLHDEMQPIREITAVREGIEPLDDDMHEVRKAIQELGPLVERIDARLGDLAPVGELAEKVPGIG